MATQHQQHVKREVKCGCESDDVPDTAGAASRRAMTARPDGAAGEGEEDAIFDEPIVVKEQEDCVGELPSVSNENALALINKLTIITLGRSAAFIVETAVWLAIKSGCVHESPLVPYKKVSAVAETCGHQAHLLGQVGLQGSSSQRNARTCRLVVPPQRRFLNYFDCRKHLLGAGGAKQRTGQQHTLHTCSGIRRPSPYIWRRFSVSSVPLSRSFGRW